MIHRCKCNHKFQDSRYGKNLRVMNKTNKHGVVRCTVCKVIHSLKGGNGQAQTNNDWSLSNITEES